MLIVLDATTIISAGFGNSALFRFLLLSSEIAGHSIYIPESVIEEVIAKFERELRSKAEKTTTTLRDLGRHIQKFMLTPIYDIDQSQEVNAYSERLHKQLSDAHCTIVPYPDVSHTELLKRAVSRHRPFDDRGSGYRDALIWHSILELTTASNDKIVFVSGDKDFRGANGELHANLVMELIQRGQRMDDVTLVDSLGSLLDQHIRPSLHNVIDPYPAEVLDFLDRNLMETITTTSNETLSGNVVPAGTLDSSPHEDFYVSEVLSSSNLDITDVHEVSEDSYLLRGHVLLDCVFDGYIPKSDTYVYEDLVVLEFDWNKHFSWVETVQPIRCEVEMVVNSPASEKASVDILSVSLE